MSPMRPHRFHDPCSDAPFSKMMGGGAYAGDWICPSCDANVFASKNNCYKCQTPRPAVPGGGGGGGGYGGAPGGFGGGGYGGGGYGGGGYGGGGGGYGGPAPRPGDWTCPSCGANVFASKRACFKCQTPKPGDDGGYGGGGGGYGGGWGGNGGGGYGGGGYGGGGGGGPPPRDGDWTCPSCGANVFASKMECYKCRCPKP